MSVMPPAPLGMIILIGRDGYASAACRDDIATSIAGTVSSIATVFMALLLRLYGVISP